MATDVSGDLNLIQDEDVLRKMWSQADDYDRKKEIRLRMYKLREQRLKSYYTGDAITAITDTPPARKHAAVTHAESITDQGFMTMKDKEIRDSESPTRDLQQRQGNEKYWTTVQDTTTSSTGDDKNFTKTYSRTSDAKAAVDDNTQVQVSAKEQSLHSAATEVTDNATTKKEQLKLQAALSSASETVGPNGERISSKSEQEESNFTSHSTTESKSATGYSKSWQSSSSSSSSSRRVYSSSSTTQDNAIQNRRTSTDRKAITSVDDVLDNVSSIRKSYNVDETDFKNTEIRNSDYKTKRDFSTVEKSSTDEVKQVSTTKDSVRKSSDYDNSNLTYFRSNRDVPYTDNTDDADYEINVKITTNSSVKNQRNVPEKTSTKVTERVFDDNVRNESNKEDSYFTKEYSTRTSSKTASQSNDVNTYETNKATSPTENVSRKGIIKHPSSLDLPKESADSQYMTTYQQSYQRINVENSPTHNAFASSLRASPDRSPVSSPTRSKSVTDRSSPERKLRSSPTRGSPERKFKTTPTRTPTSPERKFRTSPTTNSPDKDRRISVGSYTVETPRSPVRKVSDITPSRTSVTSTSTVTTSKQKRKFSSTKSKESSKKKASTPSVSPSASPTRQLTDAPDSAVESDNDSDASQATYSKSPVNFKQAFETTTTTTTAASTRSTSEQTRKSSLKKTSVSGESPRPIDKTPQSPERTSPSRTPVVEELIKPKTAYSECGLDCETKIDENIISKNVVTETSTAVNEPTVKPEKTFTAGETCEIEFTIRKNSASKGPEPITQSPIFNNVRDKSPEYSSEGSVGKEVKRMRSPVKESPSSNRSSPERSAFAPIKQFRTSPEIKKTTEPSYPAEKLRKTSNTAPITDAPVGRKPSLKRSSPTKVSSPTRSVSSSASPASSPERRSPQNKIRKPSASAPVAEETEVVESTQETRITRKTSVPRSNSKQSLTKKQPELKTPVKDRVTQGTRIPSSTDLRSSSVTRKTNRASETITITKKAPSKPTEVSRTPQRGPSNSNLKTVKTTLTATVNASPRYSSPVRKPGTPTQIARLKPSPVRGTGPSNTTTNRVTSRSEVTVTVSPSRKPAPKKETPSMKPRSHEAPKRPESPLRKPTTFSKDAKTSSLRALQLICSQEINKTENVDNFEYEVDIDENNLEDELPPDDFASDVTDRENVRTTTRSVVTKTVTTKVTPAKKPSVQALKSDNKYNRSSNEKLISRLATPKKQPTKPEIVTPKTSRVPTKVSPGKTPVAKKAPLTKKGSTGSTTGTKKTITKKSSKDSIKRVDDDSSSCSEDELHDVSITVDSSERDQKYVEELEEIRRRDESEHGSKVFATSNKDSSLLSVIVQLPSSSRESSPDYASRSQYSAAVSDDGSEKPVRYADRVSEPEDSDVNMKVKSADFLRAEGRIYEQVTDLDEESESETTKVDVSVADRVSKFLQSTKTSNTTTTSTTEVQSKKDKSVLKAAALFDKIVEDQYVPVGPSNKVIDIYSKQFPGHEAVTVEDRSDQYQEILESVLDIDGRRRSSVNVDETDDIAPTRTLDRRQSSVASINKEDYKASIKAFEKRRSSVNVNDVAAATKLSEKRRSSVKPEDVTPVSKTYESRKSSVKPEDVAPVSKTYDSRRSSANVENVVSSTSVYDRRRSSNTEDVILESKTLERRKSSIPAETKSDDVVTEEIINVEVKENKKAPFERKESAFAADYKSRKDFFEKKATTPINSVPSSPRAAPKFGTNLKTTTNQTVETREVTSFTRRDSETRKSPEKDLSTPRKPSLKDSPVENQRLPSSRKSPEKEVPSKVASPKEDAPSPRKDSLPQKDSFTTRRDSFSPKEPASPQKGPLSRKPSEKEVTPTVTDTTPTKAPADKPHESTLFKPTLSSSRRSSTPRKSPERQAPIERQPSSNELPQNVRKAPEKPTVRGAKSIMDRLSIFERGATEKTSPVKKTDFRGFGRTTKTESSSTFIQNERKVAEVEKKTDEPEPSSFERKTSRTEIVLKPATPADQKPQTRRDSSVRKSPERRPSASQPSPVEQQPRGRPESPKKSPSVSEFERKSSFTSSAAQKTVQAETSNKFSTTLRRTPSQSGPTPSTPSTAATPKRNSIVKESGTEIEEIFDVQLLEQMMESSKNYDDRRRIRAQIRIAKRKPDTTSKSSSTYETTTVTTTKTTKPTSRSSITEKVEFVTSTPKESPKNEAKSQFTSEYKTEFTSKSSTTTSGTRPVESEPSRPKEAAPTVESKKEIVLERRPSGTDRSLQKTDSFHRRGSKTADGVYEFTVTTKQSSQKSSSFATSKTEEVTGTDSITSSYGVGPTDENGLPLFGLKALRRSNTSKTLLLTDEVSAELNGTSEPDSGFRDTGGRPLFGGLKALKKSAPAEDMPEQPASPQLRDLVQRHEKHVRESTTIDNSPRQKPTRKLRDSFVLQPQDEEELVRSIANAGSEQKHSTEEATSSQKTVSLRSIMKKPDNFDSGAEVHMETRRSVISSHGTVNADGTVSVTRNVVQGKISSKNGEEPSGLITRTQYNYEAPSIHEEGRSETTTQTTTLGNRRLSTGPQITEAIEDSEESRRSSKRYVSSRSSSGTKITELLENGTDSRRSSTHEETDGKLNGILKKSGSGKFNVASSTVVTTSTSETVTNGDSSRKSSVDAERRKPSLVRGDSIKALQHKFQQATVSSSLKQNSGASVRNRSSSNSLDSSTRTTTKTSQPVESSQNETSVKTSSYSVKSKTESTSSGPTSFLDNKSKVTGVQDILERMRNADLASDVTESTEDQEARSLLNKFLGASVILQGMEAGMKSINGRSPQSLTTNSATLVNRVEKQRMASEAKTQNLDELDLETIWDEQHLKNLLEACTDYEGRRKIRARLRTVMAEHKACGDVTALVSNSVGADASMTQDCSESSSVSTKTEGNTTTRTEVHTHTSTSRATLTKSGSLASSPFAKFRQLERQHSAPSSGTARAPIYKITDPKLMNSAATIKERLLSWVKAQTKEYKNIQIENFSTSWSNGLAFCALIHHFLPNAFDYNKLTPEERRYNFELAFRVAEEEAGIAPLLDVEDMVIMRRPDWKCVFTYVQSIYRCFHKSNRAVLVFNF